MSTKTAARNPVTWFEIHTPDPSRARAFYTDVFGWSFTSDMPGYDLVGMGDAAPIGGGIASTGPDHRPMAVFCVQVDDVDTACAAIVEAGGGVTVSPQSADNGLRFAYVADPDGNLFNVWTPPTS